MFPDVEVLLVDYLNTQTGRRTLTDLPADLEEILPVEQVTGGPGGDDGFRLDAATVDVDSWAADRAAAAANAEQIRGLLLDLRGQRLTSGPTTGVITGVVTLTRPHWVPDPNPGLRRYTASYQIYAHT